LRVTRITRMPTETIWHTRLRRATLASGMLIRVA
jgi:hypothetical protein